MMTPREINGLGPIWVYSNSSEVHSGPGGPTECGRTRPFARVVLTDGELRSLSPTMVGIILSRIDGTRDTISSQKVGIGFE